MRGRVLYIAPTFLADRTRKKIRGVQVFDLAFVVELARLGLEVVVPAEGSWRERLEERFGAGAQLGSGKVRVLYTPGVRKPLWAGLAAAWMLRGEGAFDGTFIGNPARGIGPMLRVLRRRGGGKWMGKVVLQANRPPREGFAKLLRDWEGVAITAVSEHVRRQFDDGLRGRVEVCYGVADAGKFFPRAEPRAEDGLTHFCLIGKLDNAWKGAGRAVAALKMLPAEVRGRVRLHLASFEDGRVIDEPGVVCHPWRDAAGVPAFLREMDVMLVPSVGTEETFSQAMVQGMLTGLAMVSSDLPVLAEKLDTGGGVVCGSDAELSAAMERMVREPGFRAECGRRAREVALERYVWDTGGFARRYLGVKD
jgi:glycosyltransferase involved in cell wall biosynthesis